MIFTRQYISTSPTSTYVALIKIKLENLKWFYLKLLFIIFIHQYISTSPTRTCKQGPPFQIPGHIIDSEPHLTFLVKKLSWKFSNFNITYKARPGSSQLKPPWPLKAMVFLNTFIHDIYTSIHFNQPNQHLYCFDKN
jgi:hypothetical protein